MQMAGCLCVLGLALWQTNDLSMSSPASVLPSIDEQYKRNEWMNGASRLQNTSSDYFCLFWQQEKKTELLL